MTNLPLIGPLFLLSIITYFLSSQYIFRLILTLFFTVLINFPSNFTPVALMYLSMITSIISIFNMDLGFLSTYTCLIAIVAVFIRITFSIVSQKVRAQYINEQSVYVNSLCLMGCMIGLLYYWKVEYDYGYWTVLAGLSIVVFHLLMVEFNEIHGVLLVPKYISIVMFGLKFDGCFDGFFVVLLPVLVFRGFSMLNRVAMNAHKRPMRGFIPVFVPIVFLYLTLTYSPFYLINLFPIGMYISMVAEEYKNMVV